MITTTSPGLHFLHYSPVTIAVNDLGIDPTGTYSLVSVSLSSYLGTNLDALLFWKTFPLVLLVLQI